MPCIHNDGKTTREFSIGLMLGKMLHKLGVGRKSEFFDSFSFKNYSHFFNTKTRLLTVVEQAFVRLTFAMNHFNSP